MLVFNIFIYSRKGDCLYYEQWNRENSPSPSLAEEQKLLFGVLHSLKSFVSKISPASFVSSFSFFLFFLLRREEKKRREEEEKKRRKELCLFFGSKKRNCDRDDSLKYYKTSTYKLHYFETPSGLKIVLMTDPQVYFFFSFSFSFFLFS